MNKNKRKKFRKTYLTPRDKTETSIILNRIDKIDKKIQMLSKHIEILHWYGNDYKNIEMEQIKFFKKLPQASGELRVLQNILSLMLQDFAQICKENHLNYWLQAGSLIGAYRHGGWIPWDDDLDIGMPEDDLNKLKQILRNHNCYRIDDYYHFRDNYLGRFTRIKFKDKKINCFLDIPVYEFCDGKNIDDAWNNVLKNRKLFESQLLKIRKKLKKQYFNEIVTDKEDLKLITDFYEQEIKKVHKKDGKYIYWASYGVPARWKRIFEKDMFFPLGELRFENNLYKVPKQYKQYLSLQYGNIFSLPWNTVPKHVNNFNLFDNLEVMQKILDEREKNG